MGLGHPAEVLQRALTGAGVGAGDEVILPSYATVDVAEAVRKTGGVPVFVDIEADSFCIDPAAVASALTTRTAAVVPVHRFGHRADLIRIRKLADQHGLFVTEYEESSTSSSETAIRQAHAAYLTRRLTDVVTPRIRPGSTHLFLQYVVRVPGNGRPDRDAFARTLRAKGVRCSVPVQTPVHRMPQFRREVWLPETERAADECLALPIDAGMTKRELQRVASACNALGGLLQPA